jgi:hypothetical protein
MRATQPQPQAGARRRLEASIELTLDATLSSTARLILGGLATEDGRPVVWPTDQELADRHGVCLRTIGAALAAGERAGWIRRFASRKKLAEISPSVAKRVPRSGRNTRRIIVILWLAPDIQPATYCRQEIAGRAGDTGTQLPAPPAPSCQPLARAPGSASSGLRTSEERTFVPPLSPPQDPATLWPETPLKFREGMARLMAAAAAREAEPGFIPAPDVWEPPKPTPAPTARMKVEAMVAACVGPDQAAGLDALLLWLATEFRDSKPLTRAFWSRTIPAILASADGFGALVEMIVGARSKRWPSHWLSACLARGQPGAQKPTPGATLESPPGAGARFKSVGTTTPEYKYTRRVNP